MEKAIWDQTLCSLKDQLKPQAYNTWIKPLKFINIDNSSLQLGVPNTFFRDWVNANYGSMILSNMAKLGHNNCQLDWDIQQEETVQNNPTPTAPPPSQNLKSITRPDFLQRRYTFDDFVVGSSNQFANAAAMAVAENPAKSYNPLFIYGGVGLGKTHLLNSIGHQIRIKHPELNVIYASSEKFMNELINALRYQRMSEFRAKYRDCDVLLIDDIQFMSHKVKTQEEFFYTFNTLFESHRQIVMTSDRFPREIPAIEERLRSRMEWGLIADMLPPEVETRVAILKKKAESTGTDLPDDVAMFIANRIKSNVRELEGGLVRISAFASLNGVTVDLALAKQVLQDLHPESSQGLSVTSIQQTVASHFHLKIKDLCARKRTKSLAFPRQIAMYLCRKLTASSFPEIGQLFGGKDHSTVIHAVRKIEDQLSHDISLKQAVDNIEEKLGIASE